METVDNTPRVFQANTSARAQVGAKTRNARGASKIKPQALEVTRVPTGTYLWPFCSPRWRLWLFIALKYCLHATDNTDCVRDPWT